MASSLLSKATSICTRACAQTSSRYAFGAKHQIIASIHYDRPVSARAAQEVVAPFRNRSEKLISKEDLPERGTKDIEHIKPPVVNEPPNLDSGSPAKPVDMSPNPGGPEFATLKGAISYDTLKAITVKPFTLTHMSPVQAEVLPLLPQIAEPYSPDPPADGSPRPPRDLLVKARTGTGKTLAFLVPAIEARIKATEAFGKQAVKDAGLTSDKHMEGRARRVFSREHVGTLILSPTRELATQIANEALRLTHHHKDFEVRLFVGGMSKRLQMRDWMKGRRDIVVATPGRLRDMLMSEPEIARGISKTKLFILDEADTLLDMGFRDDIQAIADYLPKTPERQTFLFSATVSRAIQQVARATLDKNHVFIDTVTDSASPVHAHVPQYHTVLPSAADQLPHVLRLIAHDQLINPGKSKTILFLPTTKMTQLFTTFVRELSKSVLPAGKNTKVFEIHSKRTQEARTMTSDAFRNDRSGASILVTSDVSARGVDYPGVTRVIQVGIPSGPEQYVHRVGRCGRAGATGRGDLVLLPWEVGFVTWQLTDVTLKPLTTNELKSQVNDLAAKFDSDPKAFFEGIVLGDTSTPKYDRAGRVKANAPMMYNAPLTPAISDMPRAITELIEHIDEEAIKETFTSLLGYYIAKSHELRVQKGVIVQGCKDWTTEACGLPVPPYVSEMFLQRLGYADGRTKRFGSTFRAPGSRINSSTPSWVGRGYLRNRDKERPPPNWEFADVEEGDPVGRPEEYRSRRYGDRRAMEQDESPSNYSRQNGSGYGSGGGYRNRGDFGRRDESSNNYSRQKGSGYGGGGDGSRNGGDFGRRVSGYGMR